ncbi:GAF domain-containing sensor histidine kinase [Nocardioides marmorisolisilvae]|nr:GAF domain-containing sensor histidine kinase [Nocardioides marmorisolisilvae]
MSIADAQLEEYGVLEEPGGRDLQALVDIAATICNVPTAAINLISTGHQHQVATSGFDPSVCLRSDSMCAAVLDDSRTVIAEDASKDPRFADNPFVTGVIGDVRFYASAPLDTPSGVRIGRLCVFDEVPRPLDEDQAEVLHVLAERVVDVLELRLRSRQLEEARDELHRSNELLSMFASQVSHDLRTPLTAVLANAELLAGEPVVQADREIEQLVTATVAAGHRMATLIETILGYARVGAALERTDVSLTALVEHAISDLGPALRDRGAELVFEDLPTVLADEQQLYAVLLNLISNAVKFTPAGTKPRVVVAASRGGQTWRISVTDNGRGIPANQRDGLFELYARGDSTVDGTGIGLATARRAVEAHGGEIGIDDADGGGTTVWFTLPA